MNNAAEEEPEVLQGHRPPLLDASARRGFLVVFVTLALLAFALVREHSVGTPFDPLAMLLRVLAVIGMIRSLFFAVEYVARLRLMSASRKQRVVLSADALTWDRGSETVEVTRDRVRDVVTCGHWARKGDRYVDTFLLLEPKAGQVLLQLPPIFDESAAHFAERLMRWRGVRAPAEPIAGTTSVLASKLYDRASRGDFDDGVAAIPHGHGWLRRGPYAALVLALVVLDALVRMPNEWEFGGLGVVLIVVSLGVPIGWYVLSRRHVAPRKGLAMVLTPTELLIRIRAGTIRAQWENVERVALESRAAWSVLSGYSTAQVVRIDRDGAPPIRYDEAFLGFPAEVAAALVRGYRALGQASASARDDESE